MVAMNKAIVLIEEEGEAPTMHSFDVKPNPIDKVLGELRSKIEELWDRVTQVIVISSFEDELIVVSDERLD